MEHDDYYAILGIAPGADARDIKKAYFQKVREFPPETHAERFQQIRKAYETLSDADRRSAYDASRGDAWSGLGQELAALMRSAIEAMQQDEYETASRLLQAAVAQRPEAEEPRTRLCVCLLELKRWGDATVAAQGFVAQHPEALMGHLLLGYAHRGAGHSGEARGAFIRAHEIDPDDFRPYRAIVDTYTNDGLPVEGLNWLQSVQTAPSSRNARRFVAMELLMLKARRGLSPDGIEALANDLQDDDERDEWKRFCEGMLAVSLAENTGKSRDLLKVFASLGITSEVFSLATTAKIPIDELAAETKTWLAKQRKDPDIFVNTGAGPWLDGFVALGALGLMGVMLLPLFSAQSRTSVGSVLWLSPLYAAAGAFVVYAVSKFVRSLRSPLGRFMCLHPAWLIEVDLTEARFRPILSTTLHGATHHHTNGAYTHTSFNLSFGDSKANLSIRNQALAEQFNTTLQDLRRRLLDLCFAGMVGAIEGLEVLPPALRQPRRIAIKQRLHRLRPLAFGALGAIVALVAGCIVGNANADSNDFGAAVTSTKGPAALQTFLRDHPSGDLAAGAQRELEARRTAMLAELRSRGPALAAALAQHQQAAAPPHIAVKFVSSTSVKPLMSQKKGAVVAELPLELVQPRVLEAHERVLRQRLQATFSATYGSGWVTFSEEPRDAIATVTVTYELGLSGRAFGLWSSDASVQSPVLWAEPQLTVATSLGEQTVRKVVKPPEKVKLAIKQSDVLLGEPSVLYTQLVDALWDVMPNAVAEGVGLPAN